MRWGILRSCGEFCCGTVSSYVITFLKLKQKELGELSDYCPEEIK